MKKPKHLDRDSLRESYFTILAVFAADDEATTAQLDGIYAWGQQLDVDAADIDAVLKAPDSRARHKPDTPQSSIEQLYNLVYMIYLDEMVDDYEIEILMKYAEHLGFPQHIIGDLIKAMLTAPSDGVPVWQVKDELKDLLKASLE